MPGSYRYGTEVKSLGTAKYLAWKLDDRNYEVWPRDPNGVAGHFVYVEHVKRGWWACAQWGEEKMIFHWTKKEAFDTARMLLDRLLKAESEESQ